MKESYFLLEMRELSSVTQFALVPPDKSRSCSGPLQNTHKQRKWPYNAPNEASSPTTAYRWDGQQPPEQGDVLFWGGGGGGVYGPQSALLFP